MSMILLRGWRPWNIPGVVDFGVWSAGGCLFQTNDTSTPAVSAGQSVGLWRGVMGVLSFAQSTAASRAALAASGVRFDASGGVAKHLIATYSAAYDAATSVCISMVTIEANKHATIGFFSGTNLRRGIAGSGSASITALIRGASTSGESSTTGRHDVGVSFRGAGKGASFLTTDGGVVSCTEGSNTDAPDSIRIMSPASSLADVTVKGWLITMSPISAADFIEWQRYIRRV